MLKWYGEPSQPILYRQCKLDADNVQRFMEDVLNFFKEVGHAEI